MDKRLAACTFKEGELVVVERPTRIPGAVHKLSYTYIGPFVVKRKVGELSFEVASQSNPSKTFIVHPCVLKRFTPRDGDVADEHVEPNFVPQADVEPAVSDYDTDSAEEGDNEVHEEEERVDLFDFPPVLSPHNTAELQSDD